MLSDLEYEKIGDIAEKYENYGVVHSEVFDKVIAEGRKIKYAKLQNYISSHDFAKAIKCLFTHRPYSQAIEIVEKTYNTLYRKQNVKKQTLTDILEEKTNKTTTVTLKQPAEEFKHYLEL